MSEEVKIALRFNPEIEEVELVVNNEVAGSSGAEEFKSWVEHYNEKHPEVKVVVEEVKPVEQVVAPIAAGPAAIEPPVETVVAPVVDTPPAT